MPAPRITVIMPPSIGLNPERYRRVIENALDGIAEGAMADFQATTRTWSQPPEFQIIKGDYYRIVGTNNLIYKFVSGGTRVRYATMTGNFRAKTMPGKLYSRVGKGGVAFISKMHPRPGIKAREFAETIGKKWQKRFVPLLKQAIRVEAQRMG